MSCACINEFNDKLAEHNGILVTTFTTPRQVIVDSVKLDAKKRGKPPVALATFCPFCGVRYVPAKASQGLGDEGGRNV